MSETALEMYTEHGRGAWLVYAPGWEGDRPLQDGWMPLQGFLKSGWGKKAPAVIRAIREYDPSAEYVVIMFRSISDDPNDPHPAKLCMYVRPLEFPSIPAAYRRL